MTRDQLQATTELTVTLDAANAAIGMSRGLGQRLAREGQYPVPLIRCGRVWRVPVAPLRRLLGLDPAAGQGAERP